MKHTNEELRQWQALPLDVKILMTKARIRGWVNEYGIDGVYISYSGGKDSTVLLDIVRQDYDSIPAVYIDTGLEYPELREYVKKQTNVTIIKPKKNFKQVIEECGYPFISKEVSGKVYEARMKEGGYAWKVLHGSKEGTPWDMQKYSWLIDAPFKIGNRCCNIMKKNPAKAYEKETGRCAITAQMAEESRARRTKWLQNGCNAFDQKRPMSNPMAFWTEQDVLQYIRTKGLEIAPVYGDVVEDNEIKGQMSLDGYIPKLKTTGCKRTGCIFCGYGCHSEKPGEGKFLRLKSTHPKIYKYIMKPWDEGGLGYKEVIDWLNENGDLHIEY